MFRQRNENNLIWYSRRDPKRSQRTNKSHEFHSDGFHITQRSLSDTFTSAAANAFVRTYDFLNLRGVINMRSANARVDYASRMQRLRMSSIKGRKPISSLQNIPQHVINIAAHI